MAQREAEYHQPSRLHRRQVALAMQPSAGGVHSHSIINKPPKPAWLKDLAVIDVGLYRRFYRQKRRSFAGAGDGAICGPSTFWTP